MLHVFSWSQIYLLVTIFLLLKPRKWYVRQPSSGQELPEDRKYSLQKTRNKQELNMPKGEASIQVCTNMDQTGKDLTAQVISLKLLQLKFHSTGCRRNIITGPPRCWMPACSSSSWIPTSPMMYTCWSSFGLINRHHCAPRQTHPSLAINQNTSI